MRHFRSASPRAPGSAKAAKNTSGRGWWGVSACSVAVALLAQPSASAAPRSAPLPPAPKAAQSRRAPPPLNAAQPPRAVTAADLYGKQRVFATPGDWALSNPELTAVVRKRDGWLTELWRARPTMPSAPALGVASTIDSLWQYHQVASVGSKDYAFKAVSSRAVGSALEVTSQLTLAGRALLAVTVYEADPSAPKLKLTTTFSAPDGRAVGARLGDALRWGNVQYFVSGVQAPRMSYKGPADWVGRHGAQGDLLLRPLGATRMYVDYRARIRGFQGTIKAHYAQQLNAGQALVSVRELSFEPLPGSASPSTPRAMGRLVAELVDEAGAPIAGKLTIDRVGSERAVFDEDGDLSGADRFAWTGNGKLEVALPPGKYKVLATAGLERDARRFDVSVTEGKVSNIHADLPQVLDTKGWTSADLHLHQAPSVDADISLPARVVSIAAEGVELAAATDHYVVTDLEPIRRQLERDGVLTTGFHSVIGSEVSTLGNRFGHFNVFPMSPGTNVIYQDTTPRGLFASARQVAPHGILQVNHPRMDPMISYFAAYDVSERDGTTKDPAYSPDFDTIEVYNGDEARDLKQVRKVLMDWLHQLRDGRRYAATGSSDSHKLAILDPGLPRTFIQCAPPHQAASVKRGPATERAQGGRSPELNATLECMAALKQGRAIVTSGPFIQASVRQYGPGSHNLINQRKFELEVSVQAAPWINVSQVEVLAGTRGQRIHFESLKQTSQVQRYRRTLTLELPRGAEFIIVVAQGSRGLPNVARAYTLPFGFTNPIWLDYKPNAIR